MPRSAPPFEIAVGCNKAAPERPTNMADKTQTTKKDDLKDAGLASDTRPVPSQAEGDLETVEEDLEEKVKQQK